MLERLEIQKTEERQSNTYTVLSDEHLGKSSPIEELARGLGKDVIGQEKACRAVASRIIQHRSGLGDPNRPIASFLFRGPTGVGKTELAKATAKLHWPLDWEKHYLRIDCTELQEKHSLNKLTAGVPGFVGYGDPPLITRESVKDGAVVLLDEFEKAHPRIWQWFMPVMDEGETKVYEPTGEKHDSHREKIAPKPIKFNKTILIMTTNDGVTDLQKVRSGVRLGFQPRSRAFINDEEAEEEILKNGKFKEFPEIINRFDDIITFNNLQEEHYALILQRFLDKRNQEQMRSGGKSMIISASDSLKGHILSSSNIDEYGGREIRRNLDKRFLKKVSEHRVSGNIPNDRDYNVFGHYEDQKVVIAIQPIQVFSHMRMENTDKKNRFSELDDIIRSQLIDLDSGSELAASELQILYSKKAGLLSSIGDEISARKAESQRNIFAAYDKSDDAARNKLESNQPSFDKIQLETSEIKSLLMQALGINDDGSNHNLVKLDEYGLIDSLIALYPKNSYLHFIKGNLKLPYSSNVYKVQKRSAVEESVRAYNLAIENNPNYTTAYMRKALALEKAGERAEADIAYEKALEIKRKSISS